VISTVVLTTRERVRDVGAFKAVGMTPRQAVTMVVCRVAAISGNARFVSYYANTVTVAAHLPDRTRNRRMMPM
jgi:putative ABC transport system permease protein